MSLSGGLPECGENYLASGPGTTRKSRSSQTVVGRRSENMEYTGERYIPSLKGEVRYEHLHRYALSLNFISGRTVLDIASGDGYGAALLAGVARSVVGVDINPECVEHSKQQYQHISNL